MIAQLVRVVKSFFGNSALKNLPPGLAGTHVTIQVLKYPLSASGPGRKPGYDWREHEGLLQEGSSALRFRINFVPAYNR